MAKEKKTRLSIYLLKEGVKPEDIINNLDTKINSKEPIGGGWFYLNQKHSVTPAWVKSFFDDMLVKTKPLSQSASALYIKTIDTADGRKRTFMIPFGYGRSMIEYVHCVNDFGLKLTLNIVNRDSIRKIKKRRITSDPKDTIEQLTKLGDISNFGIDVEQDLVAEVTGKPNKDFKDDFGTSNVIGKAAFTITKYVNLDNLDQFLNTCLENYNKKTYEKEFGFIDHIKPIKDTKEYDEILLRHINDNKPEKDIPLWMSIPEIIDWDNVLGLSFTAKNEEPKDDISYDYFQEEVIDKLNKAIDIEFMKNHKVYAIDSNSGAISDSWSILSCLCCEIIKDNETFILSNGKWYEIDKDFVKRVNKSYNAISDVSIGKDGKLLEAKEEEREDDYNLRLSESKSELILMDNKLVNHGATRSKIEFCDIYDKSEKAFIHIKKYYGSSGLSHLFAQGRVSGELFLQDDDFRKKVMEREPALPMKEMNPIANEYKIIFAIISDKAKEFNLPFFSKVNLKNEHKLLNKFGYPEIYLVKIPRQTS